MFEITVTYRHRFKLISVKKVYAAESYEAAMEMMEDDMRKRGVKEKDIINYKVIRIIHCLRCGNSLYLTKNCNACLCGAKYDSFGREMNSVK